MLTGLLGCARMLGLKLELGENICSSLHRFCSLESCKLSSAAKLPVFVNECKIFH